MWKRTAIGLAALLTMVVPLGPASALDGEVAVQAEQEKIDPNTADEQLLQRVPGIGPAMASRIVEWREEHGRFERLEDLLDIRGIGEKTLEKLRPYLEIREADDGGEEG